MDDVKTKKFLGQHWLNDDFILDEICRAAELASGNFILEIGPGKGSLTKKLVDADAHVYAVEFDDEAVRYIRGNFQYYIQTGEIEIEQADIRKIDLRKFPVGYKVVANIPYYLTSHLIHLISESQNSPEKAVLLIQKEVAERVCAKPGDMSVLSVASQFYWRVSKGVIVEPKYFTPPPKVDSQVIILDKREKPMFDVDQKMFFRLVKSGFSAKRKTLLNSLSGGLRMNKSEVESILRLTNISPVRRPQELSMDEWAELYKAFESNL
ncbi:MAG: 16S rRNA (adenine(1518)-N(6)/adenine(1519)-N(6))-dimethyltransferase RsmA [Candidatus Saccharimonadales bacterium]